MAFPLIPVLCFLAIGGGIGGLVWYNRLSTKEKARADQRAMQIARTLFQRELALLTQSQRDRVYAQVKQELGA